MSFPPQGKVTRADFENHSTRHENTGADEIDVVSLSGLLADDQHVLDAEVTAVAVAHSLATAANDFLVASSSGAFAKKTLAQTLTTLGKAAAGGLASLNASSLVVQKPADRLSKANFEITLNKLLLGAGAGADPTEINPYADADAVAAAKADADIADAITKKHSQNTDSDLSPAHKDAATGVHGVGASTVESASGAQGKVDTHANLTTAHSAVSAATASRMVVRDASARAKFAAPAVSGDALIKGTRLTANEMLDGTLGQVLTGQGAGNNPAYAAADVKVTYNQYTGADTWNKPTGCQLVYVEVISGGGGGAGGQNVSYDSGGGGGGGARGCRLIEAASLGATETVTVGASGSAGAIGGSGGGGGISSFGTILIARGGGAGLVGAGGSGAGGSVGNYDKTLDPALNFVGGVAAIGAAGKPAEYGGASGGGGKTSFGGGNAAGASKLGAGGGGSGGSHTGSGGAGGYAGIQATADTGGGGAGGALATNGSPGANGDNIKCGQGGGGGGGNNVAAPTGAGGAGGIPGGGGGGGGGGVSASGAAGGAGARGEVRVWAW